MGMLEHRQCDRTDSHEPHVHLDQIGPGIRGVQNYQCWGNGADAQFLHPHGTAQCPIEGDHVQHLWNPGASFGNTLQFWCPGRFENDGTDIKFEIAATVVKKYDDPELHD